MKNPGTLFVGKIHPKGNRPTYYVYLQGYNSSTTISSHLSREYATTMMRELKIAFKNELKNYHSNHQYLTAWLINHVSSKPRMEFAYR